MRCLMFLLLGSIANETGDKKPGDKKPGDENWIEDWSVGMKNWRFEISGWGGGNDEFQAYTSSHRTASIVNQTLYIRPQLHQGDLREDFDLRDRGCKGSSCHTMGTFHWEEHSNKAWTYCSDVHRLHSGCTVGDNFPVPTGGWRARPFESSKLTSTQSFGYGTLRVTFKLPRGNFLWPAIWMMPAVEREWPFNGEIDLMESMGNAPGYKNLGLDYRSVSSALHWGTSSLFPISYTPFYETVINGSSTPLGVGRRSLPPDSWNTITLERSPQNLKMTLNDNVVTLDMHELMLTASKQQMGKSPHNAVCAEVVERGYMAGYAKYARCMGYDLPEYLYQEAHDAPFNQDFHLILNVAVGGNFFGDAMNVETVNNKAKMPWDKWEDTGRLRQVSFLDRLKGDDEYWYNWHPTDRPTFKTVEFKSYLECNNNERKCDAGSNTYAMQDSGLEIDSWPDTPDSATLQIASVTFAPLK